MFYAPNNITSIQFFLKKIFIYVLSLKGSTCPCSFLLAIPQGTQFVEQRIQHGFSLDAPPVKMGEKIMSFLPTETFLLSFCAISAFRQHAEYLSS